MVREAVLTVGGRRTRYLEAGAGWPVVLIHAFPLNADMWRPQLERVPDGWRYIAPDLRGFGPGAEPTAGPVTMDDFAADVASVIDELGIDAATIGGLSMGGYVTMAMFRAAPERFAAVILADTRPQADSPDAREGRRQLLALAREGGPSAVVGQMLPKLLGETSRRDRPALEAQVRRIAEANSTEAIAGAIEAMMGRPDSTELLGRMSRPTLVMVGEEDTITPPSDADAMQRVLPRSRMVILPGAGHLSSMETPDAFVSALADFSSSNM